MQKSATLIRKHLTPSRVSLALLVLAGTLFTSRAPAQSATPFRFVSQVSPTDLAKGGTQNLEVTKAEGDEVPFTVSVSPNPTAGKFLVSLKGSPEDRVKVKVTDKHGCVIDKHEVSGQSNLQLGFWYYPGTYTLHVSAGGTTQTVKLEKLKEEL
jgi:hypothetical protein